MATQQSLTLEGVEHPVQAIRPLYYHPGLMGSLSLLGKYWCGNDLYSQTVLIGSLNLLGKLWANLGFRVCILECVTAVCVCVTDEVQ